MNKIGMNAWKRKTVSLPLALALLMGLLSGCVMLPFLLLEDPPSPAPTQTAAFSPEPSPAGTSAPTFPKRDTAASAPAAAPEWQSLDDGVDGESWALYVYLCGSDLETDDGSATADIQEMLAVTLPENVTVVIETGGARRWHNRYVNASGNYRLVIDHNGLRVDEELPRRNMGEQGTIADFMRYCRDNHPADRTGYILWNHGAGSVWGVAFDENYDDDAIQLDELRGALTEVYAADAANPPLSFFGFDACLMATVETAATLSGYARYMTASQATEPSGGWDYAGMLCALAAAPDMSAGDFCRVICDGYYAACARESDREVTLSVTDLKQIGALASAIDRLALEGYSFARDDPYRFFSGFGREVRRSLLFGDYGSNLYDLGDVLKNAGHLFPDTARDVRTLLTQCVVYQVAGEYADRASGLSVFYSADGHAGEFLEYRPRSPLRALAYLYELLVTGEMSHEGLEYMRRAALETSPPPGNASPSGTPRPTPGGSSGGPQIAPVMPPVHHPKLEDHPVDIIDDNTYAVLDLGPEAAQSLVRVTFLLSFYDENGSMLFLGEDNDVVCDWENGVFTDNFRGVWGSLDGHIVYMEVAYECEDYVLYTIPILLGGEKYNLSVSYDYNKEAYEILSAAPDAADSHIPSRERRTLAPGDRITTLHLASDWDEDEFTWQEAETFTVTSATAFEEIDLPDGDYVFLFSMLDVHNAEYTSEAVGILIEDNWIYMGYEY